MSTGPFRVGIVGARGYVGGELIRLLAAHPRFELAYVGSRELDGQRLADHIPAYSGELRYSSPANEALPSLGADAVVLGCTELGMIVDTKANILPIYDSAEIHADAGVECIMSDAP